MYLEIKNIKCYFNSVTPEKNNINIFARNNNASDVG